MSLAEGIYLAMVIAAFSSLAIVLAAVSCYERAGAKAEKLKTQ